MKQVVFGLLILFFSCKKDKKECEYPRTCMGYVTYTIPNTVRSLVVTKDSTFLYKNTSGDTIKAIFRKKYTNYIEQFYGCQCGGPDSHFSFEYFHGIYVFVNKNLACEYYAQTYETEQAAFGIRFSDTNNIVNNMSSSNSPSSQFSINKGLKNNDLDSISINGKTYYDIIRTYDYNGVGNNSVVTSCYYSKKFGVIRFTLNSFIYEIIN